MHTYIMLYQSLFHCPGRCAANGPWYTCIYSGGQMGKLDSVKLLWKHICICIKNIIHYWWQLMLTYHYMRQRGTQWWQLILTYHYIRQRGTQWWQLMWYIITWGKEEPSDDNWCDTSLHEAKRNPVMTINVDTSLHKAKREPVMAVNVDTSLHKAKREPVMAVNVDTSLHKAKREPMMRINVDTSLQKAKRWGRWWHLMLTQNCIRLRD